MLVEQIHLNSKHIIKADDPSSGARVHAHTL